MQIRLLILILIIVVSPLCYSQAKDSSLTTAIAPNEKRAYIGLSYGFSIPMGSFSTKNTGLNGSAFAENGQNIHLFDFGYRFSKSFSTKAFYLNASNDVDESSLAKNLSQSSANNYAVQSSNYELKALMFGFGVTKINSSMDLDLHFLVGFGRSFLPAFTLVETNPSTSNSRTIQFKPSNEGGFGVGLNAGFRIHLSPQIDFLTQAAYIIFEKDFERLRIENSAVTIAESKVSYEILTLNFGLAYRFNIESKN